MKNNYTEDEKKLACYALCDNNGEGLGGCENKFPYVTCNKFLKTARRVIAAGYRRLPDEPAKLISEKYPKVKSDGSVIQNAINLAADSYLEGAAAQLAACKKHYGDER